MKNRFVFGGFTLLELMVATTLVVILGGASVLLLSRGLAAWQRADVDLQELRVMEKAFNLLGQELHNGVVLTGRPFEGKKDELFFAVVEEPTRLSQVHYRLVSKDGSQVFVREWQPFPSKEAAIQTKTLVSQVSTFSVSYGALKQAEGRPLITWTETWDPLKQPQELPKLIRVKLETKDPRERIHSATRQFWIPHGVIRELAP